MRALAQSPEVSPLALITLRNVESMYHMLIGSHAPCLEAVYDGLEIARTSGVHIWSGQLLANSVAGALGGGDLDTAERLLVELEARRERTRRLDRCLFHYFSAWHAVLRKDMVRAYQHQKTAARVHEPDRLGHLRRLAAARRLKAPPLAAAAGSGVA